MKKAILKTLFLLITTTFFTKFAYATTTLSVSPPIITLPDKGEQFTVTVSIEGAEDIAAYQFDLIYPKNRVKIDSISDITMSSFLETTGRTAVSLGPQIDNDNGIVTIGEFSYGSGDGANGDATLATITFTVLSSASSSSVSAQDTTAITLDNVEVVDVSGSSVSSEVVVPALSKIGIIMSCLTILLAYFIILKKRTKPVASF